MKFLLKIHRKTIWTSHLKSARLQYASLIGRKSRVMPDLQYCEHAFGKCPLTAIEVNRLLSKNLVNDMCIGNQKSRNIILE